ncbi:3-hydroxyacyl-CoA dehydrogenase [Salinisphaera aquimarina]|uniref:3-hydroxyacyl-CoA dehydrogenase n=1 Tax=Salinisphaera aquimarina TaxID=2094031 RepID=A0ABV7ETP0_9GAMM
MSKPSNSDRQQQTQRIAIIGVGLIGRSWAIVFARAGFDVALFDAQAEARECAMSRIKASLADIARQDLLDSATADAAAGRIRICEELETAVGDATHVQECVSEDLSVKQALYRRLDAWAPVGAVLASSTSFLAASRFTKDLPGRSRCLVAHPVNPPHLVPLVELVPAPWTDGAVVERTRALMDAVGQAPITLRKEIQGFVLNRLQGALLAEAFRLVEDGVADTADVDRAVADGLGLRWSFMGPFETIDLNAPAGVADYCARFGPMYYEMAQSQADPRAWTPALVTQIERERRARLDEPDLQRRQDWRDRRLAAVVAAKRRAARDIGE